MQKYPIATVDDLPPGERKLVEIDGKSIGVFNVNGDFIAVLNLCPHELAPVCRGRVSGTTLPSAPGEFRWGREGEILACPWHGWEFDLLDGRVPHRPAAAAALPGRGGGGDGLCGGGARGVGRGAWCVVREPMLACAILMRAKVNLRRGDWLVDHSTELNGNSTFTPEDFGLTEEDVANYLARRRERQAQVESRRIHIAFY